MLEIIFVNDGTGGMLVGNYDVVVKINGEIIGNYRVENHNRLSGWEGLVHYFGSLVFSQEE